MSRQLRARTQKCYAEGKQGQDVESDDDGSPPATGTNNITRFTQKGVRNTDKVCSPDLGNPKGFGRHGSRTVWHPSPARGSLLRLLKQRSQCRDRRASIEDSESSDEDVPKTLRAAKSSKAAPRQQPRRAGQPKATVQEVASDSDSQASSGAQLTAADSHQQYVAPAGSPSTSTGHRHAA